MNVGALLGQHQLNLQKNKPSLSSQASLELESTYIAYPLIGSNRDQE